MEIESLVNSGDSQALERTIDEIKHRVKEGGTQARLLEAVTNAQQKAEAWRAR